MKKNMTYRLGDISFHIVKKPQKKKPVLLVSFGEESSMYQIAFFKDDTVADWTIDCIEEAIIDAGLSLKDVVASFRPVEGYHARPVVAGHWKTSPTGWVYCSVCGSEPPNECNEKTRYCSYCGAKMTEEVSE